MLKLISLFLVTLCFSQSAQAEPQYLSEELGKELGRRYVAEVTIPKLDANESAGQGAGPLDAHVYFLNGFDRPTEAMVVALLNSIPEVASAGKVGSTYGVLQSHLPHNALVERPALLAETRAALAAMRDGGAVTLRVSLLSVNLFGQSGYFENERLVKQDRCIGRSGDVVELLFSGPRGSVPLYYTALGKMLNRGGSFEVEEAICQLTRARLIGDGFTATRIP